MATVEAGRLVQNRSGGHKMPWRTRLLTTRRHPLAVQVYTLTGMFGFLFMFHLLHTDALRGVPAVIDWAWRVMLLIGGAVGLAASSLEPRREPDWPDLVDLLRLEGMAAGLSAVGWAVYALSIADVTHTPVNLPTLAFGVMALGLLWRSVQATRDAAKARLLGAVADAASASPELHDLLAKIAEHKEP